MFLSKYSDWLTLRHQQGCTYAYVVVSPVHEMSTLSLVVVDSVLVVVASACFPSTTGGDGRARLVGIC